MKTLTLTHYTDEPRTLNRDRTYSQEKPDSFTHKPRGLWVSVDGEADWHEWCSNEEFHLAALKHRHRVVLADDANILLIDTPQKFAEFHQTYAVPEQRPRQSWSMMNDDAIDWPAVAFKYDGIIIAPYRWESRMGHMWYYGWDCASGCIWNLDAITEFTPVSDIPLERFRQLIDEEVSE